MLSFLLTWGHKLCVVNLEFYRFTKSRFVQIIPRLASALMLTGLLLVGAVGTLVPQTALATPAFNTNMNFQGRLLNAQGAVVADGVYNMEFKIYAGGNSSGSGALDWTENWIYGTNSPDNRVTVKNGYFSVNLGSICSFYATGCTASTGNTQTNTVVPWDTTPLWLSINIAGGANATAACTTFAGCTPDGELLPMRQLSTTPYAQEAGTCSGCILQAPTSTAQNTIAPSSANNVVALTVRQTAASSPTADVLDVQTANGSSNFIQVTSTAANAGAVTVQSFGSGNNVQITSAATLNLSGTATIIKPTASNDSLTAFRVQNAAGSSTVLDVDTTNLRVGIGTSAPATTLEVNGIAREQVQDKGGQVYNVKAYGAVGNGSTDDTAAVQSAIDAANTANGGTVYFPAATYQFASSLSLDTYKSVKLVGAGSPTGGAATATILRYAGTGSAFISAHSSVGVEIHNLMILYNSGSFTGNLVDYRNTSGSDTAFGVLADSYLGGSSSSSAGALVALDKSHTMTISGNAFGTGVVAILGEASGHYANAIHIEKNHFVGLTTANIKNSGQAWEINNNTFEQLASGAAGAYLHDSGVTGNDVTFQNNWFGDVTSGAGGAQITWAGNNLVLDGNYLGFNNGAEGLLLDANTNAGISVRNNDFVSGGTSTAIDFGSTTGNTNVAIIGNAYTSVTTKVAGTFPGGTLVQDGNLIGIGTSSPTVALDVTGGIKASGLIQGSLGLTISGAAISLNDSSNFATTINSTSGNTGAVTIGSGSNTFTLNTSNIKVSSAGAITGATGIVSTGVNQLYASASTNSTTSGGNWLRAPDGTVSAFIGDTSSTSGYTASQFSGDLRFNGTGVAWGDLGYYPNGGGNGNSGQFRFSTTGGSIGAAPNAKLGVGDLYVNGNAGIGTNSPTNTLSVSPIQYTIGTAGTGGSPSTTVTGSGTTWTAGMVGSEFVFSDGAKRTITAFGSTTSLTLASSVTEAAGQLYTIYLPALQVTSAGKVGIGTVAPTANLQVTTQTNTSNAFLIQDASSANVLNVNTNGGNIVTNNDFESNVTNWTVAKGTATITQDATAGTPSGSNALKAVVTAATSGATTSTFTSTILANTKYRLTFLAKCSSSIATFAYGRQDVTGTDVDATATATCGTGWQQYSTTYTTGGTITSPNIYMDSGTTTSVTIWIDAVSLVPVVTTTLNVDSVNSRLSIGANTGTPTSLLYVSGQLPTSSTGSISTGAGTNPYAMAIQGRYLYAVYDTSGALAVFDVSNPATPVSIASVSTTAGAQPRGIAISGHYAYVTTWIGNTLEVYDISNPHSPTKVGSLATGSNTNPIGVYVQGRYAYICNTTSNTVQVVDVANPNNPTSVGTFGTGDPQNVFVQGRYAYVANAGTNTMQILDVSNPASVSSVSTFSTGASTNPQYVYVQGRYAYISNFTSGTMQIVDVSNPAIPVSVSTTSTAANSLHKVYVQGRYAYAMTSTTSQAFDVSNPASPVNLGTFSAGSYDIVFSGRYAYLNSYGGNTITAYDMGGSYIQQLEAGGIETSTLSVNNDVSVIGNTSLAGGLQVGQALQVNGNIGISGSVLLQNTTNSATAFQVQNALNGGVFAIDTSNNRIYIGAAGTGVNDGTLLVLDTKPSAGDPTTEVDGAMYYNSNSGSFRCGQSGSWVSCIGGLLSSNTAASSAVANTTTETNFDQKVFIF